VNLFMWFFGKNQEVSGREIAGALSADREGK
jgi:hypothetical protein